MKILAKTDLNLKEAVVTVRQLTQDEKIRQMCKAQEDYYHRTAGREALLQKTMLEREQAVAREKHTVAKQDHLPYILRLHYAYI